MAFKVPAIDKVLTKKDWDKNKGIIAKMAGKTGIGSALADIEKSHSKVNWDIFDIIKRMPQGKAGNREAVDFIVQNAKAEFNSKIQKDLRSKLQNAKKVASATEAKFKKNKKIPSSSTKHVAKIASEADKLMVACNQASIFGQFEKDYKTVMGDIKKKEQVIDDLGAKLKRYINALASDMKTVKTADKFNSTTWSENIRGVGTTLPVLAKDLGLETEHKVWRKFAAGTFQVSDDSEIPERFKTMLPVLKRIVAKLK